MGILDAGTRAWAQNGNMDEGALMDGKTVFITGSTDGVGRYVAATLSGLASSGNAASTPP
jgi:hypothetical protein